MSMEMSMSLCCRQEQRQLPPTGGITESIFPKTEAWLLADGDHQKALAFVAGGKRAMNKYRSMMDFLLNETITSWKPFCMAFYKGTEAPLREQMCPTEIEITEEILMAVVVGAYERHCEKRRQSWASFRTEVLTVFFGLQEAA